MSICPLSSDLTVLKNDDAVKDALKNLLLTDRGERLMQPNLGGNIRALLFENLTPAVLQMIKTQIEETVKLYEPRAELIDVTVAADMDSSNVSAKITFYVRNQEQPITLDVILERTR